jgi:predicted nucleic acid-binding protein
LWQNLGDVWNKFFIFFSLFEICKKKNLEDKNDSAFWILHYFFFSLALTFGIIFHARDKKMIRKNIQ